MFKICTGWWKYSTESKKGGFIRFSVTKNKKFIDKKT